MLGYDSVWVRDHIVYRPHGFEDPNRAWLDPFVVLAAAAARTKRITLGTATLIPHRHPILTTQMIGSLASFAGPGRVIIGWGRGNDPTEFEAIGVAPDRRGALLEEQVEIIRALWTGQEVDHTGDFYQFRSVQVTHPASGQPLPHWYGGVSEAAIERALRAFDGLLASRIPRAAARDRIALAEDMCAKSGREMLQFGVMSLVNLEAFGVPVSGFSLTNLVKQVGRRYPTLAIEGPADLDGVLIGGTSEQIATEISEYAALGVNHFVFDLRLHAEHWTEAVEILSRTVLPMLGATGAQGARGDR